MRLHSISWIGGLLTLAAIAWTDYVSDQETQQYESVYPAQIPVYASQNTVSHPQKDPLKSIGPIVVLLALGLGGVAAGVVAVAAAAASRANIQNRIDRITSSTTSLTNLLATQDAIITTFSPTVTSTTTQVNSLCSAAMAIAAVPPAAAAAMAVEIAIILDQFTAGFMNNQCP